MRKRSINYFWLATEVTQLKGYCLKIKFTYQFIPDSCVKFHKNFKNLTPPPDGDRIWWSQCCLTCQFGCSPSLSTTLYCRNFFIAMKIVITYHNKNKSDMIVIYIEVGCCCSSIVGIQSRTNQHKRSTNSMHYNHLKSLYFFNTNEWRIRQRFRL